MKIEHIINAWRNEDGENLNDAERALLPASPVGEIDLTDVELADIDGGTSIPCVSVITVILTWFTSNYCVSISGGGTCTQQSSGCC